MSDGVLNAIVGGLFMGALYFAFTYGFAFYRKKFPPKEELSLEEQSERRKKMLENIKKNSKK